jgi:MFS family permease
VALLFLLLGVSVGGWLSRVPDVKARTGLDDTAWGATLVASTAGSFVALWVVAALVTRVGPRRLVRVSAPALLVSVPLLGASTGQLSLAAALVLFGLATSGLNTPMNAQAVFVERQYGRPVMSSFHACYSLGTLLGALLGAAGAALGVAAWAQHAGTSVALAVGLAVTRRWQPADPAAPPPTGPTRPRLTPSLAVLAVLGLCGALAEGTASSWSALYVERTLDGPAGLGGFTYACFAAAMLAGRLVGDRAVARLGRRRFLVGSGVVSAVGLGAGLASGTVVGACLGFAVLGLGLSCVIPTVYGAAGNAPGVTPGAGVATVTIASWPAFLVGPPLVGGLSDLTSLRTALLVVVLAGAVIAVLGRWVPPPSEGVEQPAGTDDLGLVPPGAAGQPAVGGHQQDTGSAALDEGVVAARRGVHHLDRG